MKADKYIIPEGKKVDIRKLPTNSKADGVDKEEIIRKYEENKQELIALQDKFYADAREGLIVVIMSSKLNLAPSFLGLKHSALARSLRASG